MTRYAVRVKPGASRNHVGGAYGDPPALVVAVTAPAVDGRATEAVLRVIAEALDVRRSAVELVSGHTARTKIVTIDGPEGDIAARWAELLRGQGD